MTTQDPVTVEDIPAPTQFYIPANSSILERRSRTLKYADTFAVCDHHGDILDSTPSPEGLFHRDTRHLSRFELLIEGRRFLLLSSTMDNSNVVLTADLANPDLYRNSTLVLSREMLHVVRSKFLADASSYERVAFQNFDRQEQNVRVTLRFAADFADLFEVRGITRARRGRIVGSHARDWVQLRYEGLDEVTRITRIDFDPAPSMLTNATADFDLAVPAGGRRCLFLTVRCNTEEALPKRAFFPALRQARRAVRHKNARRAAVSTSNAMLNQALTRSISDLNMLVTETPQGPYPYAGIPWFSAPFGRDGIITALEMLWLDPALARGVLGFLAAHQATADDPARDAEPGKIVHEMRTGEMANLGEVPFGCYYGSVDATPLFVLLAGRYFERTGDLHLMQALWPNIEAALTWIDRYGDIDQDGFVEYRARGDDGLVNQGWKDSQDAISHADGSLAQGPIALVEVQAYVYAAKKAASEIAYGLGHNHRAVELTYQALALQEKFEDAFWCEELGTYALALDGRKQPCRVRSSNAGHALFAGIASREHAVRVMRTLMNRESFAGWGIRTLAGSAARFNPMAYHNGSVWPHDNALIALGFARYGYKEAVLRVFTGLFEALQYMDLLRLPELFCGFAERVGSAPTLYPVACAPQAWASGALFAMLEACLGLHCDQAGGEIRFETPVLPAFVDGLTVSNLALGESTVDIALDRRDADVAAHVLSRTGTVRVVTVS